MEAPYSLSLSAKCSMLPVSTKASYRHYLEILEVFFSFHKHMWLCARWYLYKAAEAASCIISLPQICIWLNSWLLDDIFVVIVVSLFYRTLSRLYESPTVNRTVQLKIITFLFTFFMHSADIILNLVLMKQHFMKVPYEM